MQHVLSPLPSSLKLEIDKLLIWKPNLRRKYFLKSNIFSMWHKVITSIPRQNWYLSRDLRKTYILAQWRHKSACASAQSDQSLRCPHKEAVHHCAIENEPTEPLRQKTYLRTCAPSEDSDQTAHSESSRRILVGQGRISRLIRVYVARKYQKAHYFTLRLEWRNHT